MKFTMQRDRVVASTTGHAVAFKKGVPAYVPPEMHAEVLEMGAEPDTEIPETQKPAGAAPADPAERRALIANAMEDIVLANNREDFTAAGSPHNKAVSLKVGFPVDARERDKVWESLKQAENA